MKSNKLSRKSKKGKEGVNVQHDDNKTILDDENIELNSPDKDKEVINTEADPGKQKVRFSGLDETTLNETILKDKEKERERERKLEKKSKTLAGKETLGSMSTEFDTLGRAMSKMQNPFAKTTKDEAIDDDENSFVQQQNQDQDIAKKVLNKINVYDYHHYLQILKSYVNKKNANHQFSPK